MRKERLKTECDDLRAELIAWQERRFAVLGGTFVIISALVSWIIQKPQAVSWEMASALALYILSGACYLSWMFARFTVAIGAYCEVFHNYKWEMRYRIFEKREPLLRFNLALAIMYFGIGIASVTIFRLSCSKTPGLLEKILFGVAALLYTWSEYHLAFSSYPRKKYLSHWLAIKREEE